MLSRVGSIPIDFRSQNRQQHTDFEEILHALSHGVGVPIAIFLTIVMLNRADTRPEQIAVLVFGISSVLVFAASAVYHGAYKTSFQPILERLDHAAIYIKIAGSYTPFMLLVVPPHIGSPVLVAVWGVALFGGLLKLYGTAMSNQNGGQNLLSLMSYLGFGWVGVFLAPTFFTYLSSEGFAWLVAGGIWYSVGAIFYAWTSVRFTHVIFHVCVLIGSGCHFHTIYNHVLS